jgi:hypothetical protein
MFWSWGGLTCNNSSRRTATRPLRENSSLSISDRSALCSITVCPQAQDCRYVDSSSSDPYWVKSPMEDCSPRSSGTTMISGGGWSPKQDLHTEQEEWRAILMDNKASFNLEKLCDEGYNCFMGSGLSRCGVAQVLFNSLLVLYKGTTSSRICPW